MPASPLVCLVDPLCGWCYGAGPGLDRLAALGQAPELVPTGLFAGPGARQMDAAFARHAWSNDQRIAEMTGVTFSETYRSAVLGTGGRFDSGPATRALLAAAPGDRIAVLGVLQRARYVAGRDLTDPDTLVQVLAAGGFARAAETLGSNGAALDRQVAEETARGRDMMRRSGARGVPALLSRHGEVLRQLSPALLYDMTTDLASGLIA